MTFFQDKVWQQAKKIPKGKVTTYKELACALGNPRAGRAVGQALNKNQNPVKIPCHRVVCSSGRIGGYKVGVQAKKRLLKKEGVDILKDRIVDFGGRFYKLTRLK
jgi:methylated-DNA-[protein]-cysteine S-methyltransferase